MIFAVSFVLGSPEDCCLGRLDELIECSILVALSQPRTTQMHRSHANSLIELVVGSSKMWMEFVAVKAVIIVL